MLAVVLVAGGAALLVTRSGGARRRLGLVRNSRAVAGHDMAAALLALGVFAVLGGVTGAVAGLCAGAAARTGLALLERRRPPEDPALQRQAADAVDCLAACLRAGVPVWAALAAVSRAFDDPIGPVLHRVVNRHAMGAGHADTFAELLDSDALAPVARVLMRSVESGASLGPALGDCADQMRAEHAAALQVRARSAGVKAVGPLAVCFLPAFVLLAVVPIVGSLVMDLI